MLLALADLWRAMRRNDSFPVQPVRGLLAPTGRGNHLVAADAFPWLPEQHLGVRRLEDAACQLCSMAAEVTTGRQAVLSRRPVFDAGMAGAAVPGVFPPVRPTQRNLMDGAVANRTPISVAVEAGTQTVYAAYGSSVARARRTAAVPAGHLPGRFPPQPRTHHTRPGEHPHLACRRSARRCAVPADAHASMTGCGLRGLPTSG
ncbi:patatin-like phospholipase family protein [Streptomyces sp. NPDC052101]|uniref:patatin-like phospholipase family protein n=1 Tax=Streptomyces sp. NPDC052101 TaxID=3155763 RepID=UPI00341EADA3